jgi:arylformamidase
MIFHSLSDYDDAYANGPNIARAESWVTKWTAAAAAFRETLPIQRQKLGIAYGQSSQRQNFDLFLPLAEPRGLVVFIHGGYWLRNDNSLWSHLSAGPLARGYAVAMPTYRLCPEVRIGEIVHDIADAIEAASALVAGPLTLTGHSAGGHLASRMICFGTPLESATLARVARVVSISGVHDLRPLLHTTMREPLRLDEEEARRESPALLEPAPDAKLVCWVGGAERAEFRRQNALLANIWTGLGASTSAYEAPDKHHFSVVDELEDPASGLVAALLD